MKIKLKVEKEFELKTIQVKAEVRYWEDSEINGVSDTESGDNVPCKNNSLWCPLIEIETGLIRNWEIGVTANIHYKVCDCCGFDLMDDKGEVIFTQEDGYVPDSLATDGEGYGDYIIMSIDANGFIENWYFNIDDFIKNEDND